jgi:hypothetical protein
MFLFKWIYIKIYGQETWDIANNLYAQKNKPTKRKRR